MNQEKIWDHFQTEGVTSFVGNRKRLKFITRKIKPYEKDILNIGVGNGLLELLLIENEKNVFALDPSSTAIENLRKNLSLSKNSAQVGYSQQMPFADSSFDVVVMSEVIEHLTPDILSQTLKEVQRVLRPGGRLLGTVPANDNLFDNKCVCPKCGNVFHRWGHLQSFTKKSLLNIFKNDFSFYTVSRHFYGDYSLVNWKGKISYFFKNTLMSFGIHGSGENFFFIAKKSL